ncbi:hypothetical protein, variant 1 [Aphanomyces invadans]|uniref:EF-hand domain-containing protein n=1 Tax=Aphanomyces invadans TaxID=157072 RepID=A0A024TIE3_9STRA|nr:hypothetical protein, variant 1 [Aphanomyces invadans]ETV93774.1 hypothetical protein, variant 1 [Aphanomyces invadans]|eukprot:XP_008877582.1 hypothetical protein, variant 1 [Aphanomyces invadans]
MRKSNSCLDIMMRLQMAALTAVKADFESYGPEGLTLEDFVTVLLKRLMWTNTTVVELVDELVDLFGHIVTNGQGTMVWDDFTSALIDAGMATGLNETQWRDMKYEENVLFVDSASRQPKHVQYISELRKLIVFEGTRPVLQVYDPTAILATESTETSIDDPNSAPCSLPLTHEIHPLVYTAGYRRDQDAVRSEHSPVQAIKYLTTLDILAVSAGDLKLSFWNCAIMFTSEIPNPMELVTTEHPQRILEWAPAASRLFTVSIDNRILVWMVAMKGAKKCTVTCTHVLDKHKDIVQDLLLVNDDTLISCSMDSLILIWDPHTLQCKSTRAGHKYGVRTLARHSSTMFVSAGFDMDMLGWDVSGLSNSPIFKLTGHLAPIVAIQIVAGCDQAVSLDEDGWFKWWNLQNLLSTEDNDRCLQTFRFGSDEYPWKPTSFTLFHNGTTIVACGYRVKWIQRVRLKPKLVASNAVLYNDHSFTVLSTTDKELRVWDAVTGALLHVFRSVTRSDITQVVFDTLQRKCIVANQGGEIIVLNAASGTVLKTFPRHSNQVSCLHYCKEDGCVLSASWDKSLRVYDDRAPSNVLLRSVADAHDSDIKSMAYSHSLSLVATASNDGHIKVWDYVYFLLDQQHHTGCEVNCLAFLEPYPLLVSGHENGTVCLFTVRPSVPQLLYKFSTTTAICTMHTYYDEKGGDCVRDDITMGTHVLVVGDQSGMMRCWALNRVLQAGSVETTPEAALPANNESYNPRRRIQREGKTASRLDLQSRSSSNSPRLVDTSLVTVVAEWKAHSLGIRSICVVDDPKCIFTCSFDKSTKVWAYTGECLGVLCGDKELLYWKLIVDTNGVSERKLQFAHALWHSLKDRPEFILPEQPKTSEAASTRRPALAKQASAPTVSPSSAFDATTCNHLASDKDRLFGQLRGECTWNKPEIQLARERAWEVEAFKYQARMEKIFKIKRSPMSSSKAMVPQPRIGDNAPSSFMESLSQVDWSELPKTSLTALPQLNSTQLTQAPYDDKDNWKIDSKNRQQMIYSNLFSETCRTAKQLQGKRQPKLMLENIDIAPSPFLLEKLGPDKAYKKPRYPLRATPLSSRLTPSQSLPALRKPPAKTSSPRRQLYEPKTTPEHPQNQHMDQIERIIQHATRTTRGGHTTTHDSTTQSQVQGNNAFTTVKPVHLSASIARSIKLVEDDVADKLSKPKKASTKSSKKRSDAADQSTALVHKAASLIVAKPKPAVETTKDRVQADQALLLKQTFGPYAKEMVYEVCKLFVDTDVDNSGSIETKEFVQRLVRVQGAEMKDELESLFECMDHDHNGSLDMAEMLKAIFPKANARVRDDMMAYSRLALSAVFAAKPKQRELSKDAIDDLTQLFRVPTRRDPAPSRSS